MSASFPRSGDGPLWFRRLSDGHLQVRQPALGVLVDCLPGLLTKNIVFSHSKCSSDSPIIGLGIEPPLTEVIERMLKDDSKFHLKTEVGIIQVATF